MNETHDPGLGSWVESANDPSAEFPIQNLPFGVFSRRGGDRSVGVAIGEMILDVAACARVGLLTDSPSLIACGTTSLNSLMGLDPGELSRFRAELSQLLSDKSRLGQQAGI